MEPLQEQLPGDDDRQEVELLRELLLRQAQSHEQLGQEADRERFELLEVLRQKDEHLEYEENAACKLRAVLSSCRSSTKHYRGVCAFRAWREHVQSLCAERALLRARNKVSVGRVRNACGLLRLVLKHAVQRPLGGALQSLCLHAASFDATEHSLRSLPEEQTLGSQDVRNSGRGFKTRSAQRVTLMQRRAASTKKKAGLEAEQGLQDIFGGESGYSTPPRRASSGSRIRTSPAWAQSPVPRGRNSAGHSSSQLAGQLSGSLRSDVSTALPSPSPLLQSGGAQSCSSSISIAAESALGTELPVVAASRLASILETAHMRQLYSCLSCWGRKVSMQGQLQQRYLKLEQQLAEQASWRKEAESRIREMTSCGESLELQRLELRRELSEANRQEHVSSEQAEALKTSLEQEEQLSELLKARLWALEQDHSEMANETEAERAANLKGALRDEEQISALAAEHARLSAALCQAEASKDAAAAQAAEKVRRSLLEAWGRDRNNWTEVRAELRSRVATAEDEARLAQHAAEKAEAELGARMRREAAQAREVARAELRGEELMCSSLAVELRERIAQAEMLEAGLECRLAEADGGAVQEGAGSPDKRPSTPQLRELDTYAEFVDQLRSEVAQERAQRQASANSLATLRNSYRILLQRAATNNIGDGRPAAAPREKQSAMPMAWAH